MDLKESDILGDSVSNHWYYRSKASAVTKLLGSHKPKKILDVGAGSGFFSKHMLENTGATEAWCVDTSYETESVEMVSGKRAEFVRSIGNVDADLVLLMDILEHVDDDLGLLSEYAAKVPEGSRFLITVPAFNFLWSAHDEFLEHRRRYTLSRLETVVRSANLKSLVGSYYFASVFPIATSIRLLQKLAQPNKAPQSQMTAHSPIVNGILGKLCAAELPFVKYNRIAGLSVCCLAEKTEPAEAQLPSGRVAA